MRDSERFRLRFGKYRTPCFRMGQTIHCEVRGDVVVVGITDAPIPWPIGRAAGAGGNGSLIVYGALARAVRREANQAVAHWWGVTGQTITKWRRALGVPAVNDGQRELLRANFDEPWGHRARRLAWAKARDPERCAKIAAARKGKPRPKSAMEPARLANIGRVPSAATRAKMSASQKKRGAWPPAAGRPWTAAEEKLLATLPTAEVAKRTGRSVWAVNYRRRKLQNEGR